MFITYIAHRGNTVGPNPDRENEPVYVDEAIAKGFDVEVDLWVENGNVFLGHDEPRYPISREWLLDRSEELWVHCKNKEALEFCFPLNLNYFWHQADDYTVTSRGFLWTYPGMSVPDKGVMVEKDRKDPCMDYTKFYYLCSDWVEEVIKGV